MSNYDRYKFRLWNKLLDTFNYGSFTYLYNLMQIFEIYFMEYGYLTGDIQQCIGRDKNDNEIYEGDFIGIWEHSQLNQNWIKIAKVIWNKKSSQFIFEDIHSKIKWDIDYNKCEIIGNIYENSDESIKQIVTK